MVSHKDHWVEHAVQWQHVGPPLRPCPQDIKIFEEVVACWADSVCSPLPLRALLLGVTPELALMHWPSNTRLLAIDRCPAMISMVWPAKEARQAQAVCGDWRELSLPSGSIDIVLGDGCFTTLSYPQEYHQVAGNLYETLSSRGWVVLRFFIRPLKKESVSEIWTDLQAGRIVSFHACKWRLAMALHGPTAGHGVCLDDIWRAWHHAEVDKTQLKIAQNWTPDVMATINNYRGVMTRYHFPTLTEVRQIFTRYFQEKDCHVGDYELADRCPIFVFSKKK
jgi:hypothetical protein